MRLNQNSVPAGPTVTFGSLTRLVVSTNTGTGIKR
ncbi:hypothetical protein AWB72_01273 [Caballeronia concitans]|uniref:Uncharacterized protein n=1 Tax=Caballeronia concitans TaxID=1777133 RepID=A0A658QTL6_9BURK|nr:hypothetical protein BurMR1_2219 [Burkholderia sp. MR1]SAL19931.1 hypothetical protein AWB72_01273 [Caballeronia concitans]